MSKINEQEEAGIITRALVDFFSMVPTSSLQKSDFPERDSEKIVSKASWKAALISGSLALPPGPWGMATILPDLIAIWKVQAQMVADIAAIYGKTATLTPEAMLYCCFKHGASHVFRDVVVRMGERILVKRTTLKIIQEICAKIGIKITQRLLGKTISRWVPIFGALAVGAYAKYDTNEVGKTASDFFKLDIEIEGDNESKAA